MVGKISELTAKTGAEVYAGTSTFFEVMFDGGNYKITDAEMFNLDALIWGAASALAGSGVHATQDKIPISDNGVVKHILVPEIGAGIFALASELLGSGVHATQDHLLISNNGVVEKILMTEAQNAMFALATAIDTGYHATEDHVLYSDNGVASKITIPNLLEAILALNTTALTGAGVHATQDAYIISDNGVPKSITVAEQAQGAARQLVVGMGTETTANLSSAAHAINTTGKFVGKCVRDSTTSEIMYATGTDATDVWDNLSGGSDVTPS